MKRYTIRIQHIESPSGDWVLWSDVEAMVKAGRLLVKSLESTRDAHRKAKHDPYCVECGADGGRWPCVSHIEARDVLIETNAREVFK